jgi:hypothetical protein
VGEEVNHVTEKLEDYFSSALLKERKELLIG